MASLAMAMTCPDDGGADASRAGFDETSRSEGTGGSGMLAAAAAAIRRPCAGFSGSPCSPRGRSVSVMDEKERFILGESGLSMAD